MPGGGGFAPGSRTWRASAYCCSRSASAMGERLARARALQLADGCDLAQQGGQRREVEVALEQRGPHAMQRVGMREQRPHLVLHRGAVGVDLEVVGLVEVAGDVVA